MKLGDPWYNIRHLYTVGHYPISGRSVARVVTPKPNRLRIRFDFTWQSKETRVPAERLPAKYNYFISKTASHSIAPYNEI